jgi:hypothetical protein
MLTYERQENIFNALTDPKTIQWKNGITADGILVSAGGDDVVGDSFAVYLDYQGGGLDAVRFQGILASVQASYLDLFALRDIAAAEVGIDPEQLPIFGHCYDYAIPNGVPAGSPFPLSGPWLQPSLNFAGYNYNDGLTIVQTAINAFKQKLLDLANNTITLPGKTTNNFILIDTTGTLTRDNSVQMAGQTSYTPILRALLRWPLSFWRHCKRITLVGFSRKNFTCRTISASGTSPAS